jgi:adenosylcobyric acid synthase
MPKARNARSIMFMGTGSDVGKSLIVAGIARALKKRDLSVAPFKPQNMSNNAGVTVDGGEIGRAQLLQARAAGVAPTVHMNPVLLKPESTTGAQVVVQGKRVASMKAREFFGARQQFMPAILESFEKLRAQHDVVLVEGAGSPAEVNLREGDLANFGFANAADIPALLIGDIHRGGVIASIIGTMAVLDPADAARMKGFLINKFHGDPTLFEDGITFIKQRTGLASLGVIPHFDRARILPAEDAVALEEVSHLESGKPLISVLRLPRIANFDDLDPLRLEPNINLQFVKVGEVIPTESRLVIIPGSKSTITDLKALREAGWDIDLAAHVRRGGHVLGICGGYQMLGKMIHDPDGLEGAASSAAGLGLLDVETVLKPAKTLELTNAKHAASGETISAYEIHLGETTGPDCTRHFAKTPRGRDGARSINGRVEGTYLHGCFTSDAFRAAYVKALGLPSSDLAFDQEIEATLDLLAQHLEDHLDIDRILELAR